MFKLNYGIIHTFQGKFKYCCAIKTLLFKFTDTATIAQPITFWMGLFINQWQVFKKWSILQFANGMKTSTLSTLSKYYEEMEMDSSTAVSHGNLGVCLTACGQR